MRHGKPLIGVTLSIDPGKRLRAGHEYLYIKRSYTACIAKVGGYALLVPPDMPAAGVAEVCDGLVISGGDDLPSTFADGTAFDSPSAEVEDRIAYERGLIDAFSAAKKPVLGVCYGMQLINLHFGGTLHVELGRSEIEHGGAGVSIRHHVITAPGSTLRRALGERALVASSHHQAIDRVAPGFEAAAHAEDGVIEAIEGRGFIGVEWHPETDSTGAAVYGHLIELARQ